MSNIPLARQRFADLLLEFGLDDISPRARRAIKKILPLLVREKITRRAPSKRSHRPIPKSVRRRVKTLARTTNMTYHQIANATGLANGGRVSEVVRRKR